MGEASLKIVVDASPPVAEKRVDFLYQNDYFVKEFTQKAPSPLSYGDSSGRVATSLVRKQPGFLWNSSGLSVAQAGRLNR